MNPTLSLISYLILYFNLTLSKLFNFLLISWELTTWVLNFSQFSRTIVFLKKKKLTLKKKIASPKERKEKKNYLLWHCLFCLSLNIRLSSNATFHLPLFSSFQPQSLSIISLVTIFTPQFTTLTISRFSPQHKPNSKSAIVT